jgi:hypothetical protein
MFEFIKSSLHSNIHKLNITHIQPSRNQKDMTNSKECCRIKEDYELRNSISKDALHKFAYTDGSGLFLRTEQELSMYCSARVLNLVQAICDDIRICHPQRIYVLSYIATLLKCTNRINVIFDDSTGDTIKVLCLLK